MINFSTISTSSFVRRNHVPSEVGSNSHSLNFAVDPLGASLVGGKCTNRRFRDCADYRRGLRCQPGYQVLTTVGHLTGELLSVYPDAIAGVMLGCSILDQMVLGAGREDPDCSVYEFVWPLWSNM